MDINALKTFHAAAEEGSVSKAAGRLNCVQSNVTARLRQLEEELDVQLLYRKKRGMELTPAGKTLWGYASQAIRLIKEAETAVRETGPIKGPLVIGALDSTAAVHLPPAITRFLRDFPEVELSIRCGSTDELIQMVLDYKLDGAFVTGPVESPEIEQDLIFQEELVLLTALHIKTLAAFSNIRLGEFREHFRQAVTADR